MSDVHVLSVASEAFPLIKTGGLADVVGALPGALEPQGVRARTLIPGYPAVMGALDRTESLHRWKDHFGGSASLLAARHEADGDSPRTVLEAIRWHTLGSAYRDRCGRALYMADFLEPGRPFSRADRAFLAAHAPQDFDGVFRQVVRARIEWTVREGKSLYPETAALWNSVR